MAIDVVFSVIILVFSVVIHEVSHGYAANVQGDPTARYAGRLTLNPLKHLDPVGSILVPLLLAIVPPHMVFGWAKPVPYNPYNLKNRRFGEVLVAAAGPGSNLLLAAIFGLLIRLGAPNSLPDSFLAIAGTIVAVNLILAVFNLMPVPPLDGFRILFGALPYRFESLNRWLERYSLVLIVAFIFFLWQFVTPVIGYLFSIFTGIHLL